MSEESAVTQWMVDQLVTPEVQAQIADTYKGIPMDSIRLAWPFKTEEEIKECYEKENPVEAAEDKLQEKNK